MLSDSIYYVFDNRCRKWRHIEEPPMHCHSQTGQRRQLDMLDKLPFAPHVDVQSLTHAIIHTHETNPKDLIPQSYSDQARPPEHHACKPPDPARPYYRSPRTRACSAG